MGPWIVPREFYGDPMENLHQTLSVGGEQRFLQPGDVIEATIEGIGTLTIPVAGEDEPPGGTGARLPPVRSYRGRR